MDAVLTSGIFRPKEIKRVNWCRLYLGSGIVTVADIATAAGDAIRPEMYSGTALRGKGKWHKVEQRKPDKKSWAQWRRACRLFCKNHKDLRLFQPLGD